MTCRVPRLSAGRTCHRQLPGLLVPDPPGAAPGGPGRRPDPAGVAARRGFAGGPLPAARTGRTAAPPRNHGAGHLPDAELADADELLPPPGRPPPGLADAWPRPREPPGAGPVRPRANPPPPAELPDPPCELPLPRPLGPAAFADWPLPPETGGAGVTAMPDGAAWLSPPPAAGAPAAWEPPEGKPAAAGSPDTPGPSGTADVRSRCLAAWFGRGQGRNGALGPPSTPTTAAAAASASTPPSPAATVRTRFRRRPAPSTKTKVSSAPETTLATGASITNGVTDRNLRNHAMTVRFLPSRRPFRLWPRGRSGVPAVKQPSAHGPLPAPP